MCVYDAYDINPNTRKHRRSSEMNVEEVFLVESDIFRLIIYTCGKLLFPHTLHTKM